MTIGHPNIEAWDFNSFTLGRKPLHQSVKQTLQPFHNCYHRTVT